MATYYGYADRTASSEVNWAEIGKNITDMLSEEAKIREQKKAEIDEASRQFGKTLAEAPIGESEGVNNRVTAFANDASQMMLMQDRLLKSGMLKVNQYTLARQNLTDGTKRAFDLSKKWGEFYAEKMARAQADGGGSGIEIDDMESIEGFAKLSNTKFYINPTNGMISVGKTKKVIRNGVEVEEMDTNPNNFNSINELDNFLKKKTDKFNVDAAVNSKVKLVADFSRSILKGPGRGKAGSITELMDSRQNPEYNDFVSKTVDSLLVNETSKASVLRDYAVEPTTGEQYFTTFDPEVAKANPNAILKVKDGEGGYHFEFTKEQNDVAKDYVQNQLEMQVKSEEKKSSIAAVADKPFDANAWMAMQQKQKSEILGENLALAIGGATQDDVNKGIAGLNNLPGIQHVIKDEVNGTMTVYTDNSTDPMVYNIKGGLETVFNQIVQGLVQNSGDKLGVNDVDTKKGALNYSKANKYNSYSNYGGKSADRRAKVVNTAPGGTPASGGAAGDKVFGNEP
jgi:hypothetical protein